MTKRGMAIAAAVSVLGALGLGGIAYAQATKKPRARIPLSEWPVDMAAASVYTMTNPARALRVTYGPSSGPGFVGFFGSWLAQAYRNGNRVFVKPVGVLDYILEYGRDDSGVPSDFAELVLA